VDRGANGGLWHFAASFLVEDVFLLTAHVDLELLLPVVAGELRAVARVTEQDERRIVAEGDLYDGDGRLVARSKGTFARSKIALSSGVHYLVPERSLH